jgi:hypothetical protein
MISDWRDSTESPDPESKEKKKGGGSYKEKEG